MRAKLIQQGIRNVRMVLSSPLNWIFVVILAKISAPLWVWGLFGWLLTKYLEDNEPLREDDPDCGVYSGTYYGEACNGTMRADLAFKAIEGHYIFFESAAKACKIKNAKIQLKGIYAVPGGIEFRFLVRPKALIKYTMEGMALMLKKETKKTPL